MQETEKIWMNGELVDWADAKVHVGIHGLHYGTGVFEGIRCYDTPRGPAVFRLGDHLQRLRDSGKLLYMEIPYTVEELRGQRTTWSRQTVSPPVTSARSRSSGTGPRRPHARKPRRHRDHELAVGRVPRRGGADEGHHRDGLVLAARGAERDPARREGDRDLSQLDARDHRGAAAPGTTRRSC